MVVGAGPNGLAAAIVLARAGHAVEVYEAADTIGGGCRTAELTLPGFRHDVCSSVHPLAKASPFFRALPLDRHGVAFAEPTIELAHPLDDGSAALVHRDLDATADALGVDAAAYRALLDPLLRDWPDFIEEILGPLRIPRDPRRALALARFGLRAVQSVTWLARPFRTPGARALLAGCAAHSMLRLREPASGAFALTLLTSAHAVGWPFVRGGSQSLADALAAELVELGGRVRTGWRVDDLRALPGLRPGVPVLLDLVPRDVLRVAGTRVGRGWSGRLYAAQLRRFRHGPGVAKLDLALDGPIPWRAAGVGAAGTVHLGGTLEEIAAAEAQVRRGRVPARPFVILTQPGAADPTRAPDGRQVAWAYCHVPNGATVDMTEPILRQLERFAPGVRDRILAVRASGPADLERHDANYVGGDINGGLQDLAQLFTRPAVRRDPYATPDPDVFVCSSSTPPGGGVHGMCGYHAARSALGHSTG